MKWNWNSHHGLSALALVTAAFVLLSGCANKQPAVGTDQGADVEFPQAKRGTPQPGQRLFASPEEAAGVLKDAVAAKDRRTLVEIFGQEGKQLIFTGDRVQEDDDMQAFSNHMNEYLSVDQPSANTAILHIGKENWPFPIPLVKSADGWFFDTVAGRDELLDRRIGADELNAIAVCRAYVAAQMEYARKDRTGDGVLQYAQHFMSHAGKKDGLYWEAGPDQEISPMGPLVAEARMENYPIPAPKTGKPHPYKGYIFHILKAQGNAAPGGQTNYVVDGKMTGGFALVASPSAWGRSGIMTFIVARDGKVYQKNLGQHTRDVVKAMTEYNPDKSWQEVKDQG